MSDPDDPWDPRRVWWQGQPGGPVSLTWRVEVARRALREARQREADDEELRGWLRRLEADREAYAASPEGKAAQAAAQAAAEARSQAEREKAFAELHAADMARRHHRLPAWAAWAAWQVAMRKRRYRAVGEDLGGLAASVVGKGIEDYLYVSHPEVTAAWYQNCPLDSAQRRAYLRAWLRTYLQQHFAGGAEPAFPGRVVSWLGAMPARPASAHEYTHDPQYWKRRNAWVYQQRLAGRTLQEIADAVALTRGRVQQICEVQERRDMWRRQQWSKPWRAPRNMGRPIDMGGPRDVWLTYGVPADPRLDNMWPVRWA